MSICKKTKPLRERMRREKMNTIIDELKELILGQDYHVSGPVRKLAKADVLGLVLKRLKNPKRNGADSKVRGDG